MSQTNTIILRFPESKAAEFERLFKDEVLPLWRKFKSEGKFLAASLTPIQGGMTPRKGLRHYVLHVEVPGIDRKSTRLNSSHSQISYAVFCLKKKKKMITRVAV